MKKLAFILAVVMLMLSLCATALADGEYATAFDLYQAWFAQNGYENPYPDYISGVWSADGSMDHFVFGVTDDERGEAGKAEILRLVADDTTVDFAYQNYSYAELLAIRAACKKLETWRLSGCDLYVTLEPCPMCAGAIINARVDRVFFGCKDARGGALGSVMDLRSYPLFSKPEVISGICENECRDLLQRFFKNKR